MGSAETIHSKSLETSQNVLSSSREVQTSQPLRNKKVYVESIRSENSELSTTDNSPMTGSKKYFDGSISKYINGHVSVHRPYGPYPKALSPCVLDPPALGPYQFSQCFGESNSNHSGANPSTGYAFKNVNLLVKEPSWLAAQHPPKSQEGMPCPSVLFSQQQQQQMQYQYVHVNTPTSYKSISQKNYKLCCLTHPYNHSSHLNFQCSKDISKSENLPLNVSTPLNKAPISSDAVSATFRDPSHTIHQVRSSYSKQKVTSQPFKRKPFLCRNENNTMCGEEAVKPLTIKEERCSIHYNNSSRTAGPKKLCYLHKNGKQKSVPIIDSVLPTDMSRQEMQICQPSHHFCNLYTLTRHSSVSTSKTMQNAIDLQKPAVVRDPPASNQHKNDNHQCDTNCCNCPYSMPASLLYSRFCSVKQKIVSFSESPLYGSWNKEGELRRWPVPEDIVISQNNSKRKVHRGLWYSRNAANTVFPVAVKFVEDANARDGHSIKREIECYLYIYQHLEQLKKDEKLNRLEDAWPSAELFGYYMNKQDPGQCVIITRKLSGPDLFDIIRQEASRYQQLTKLSPRSATLNALTYQLYKLHWCALALKRVQQYAKLGIRHNDVKPDNIVLDSFVTPEGKHVLDVKIIDLGTASMYSAKEFTGGTSWYESPEQKILEYFSKNRSNLASRGNVMIDLSSDVWAAGLSVTEILLGRRVVDTMNYGGPPPLLYRGQEKGWEMEPENWVSRVREILFCTSSAQTSSSSSSIGCANGLDQVSPAPSPESSSTSSQPPNLYLAAVYFPLCFHAARLIFDSLVRPKPSDRGTLQQGIEVLEACVNMVSARLRHLLMVQNTDCQYSFPNMPLLTLPPSS